MDRRNSSKGCEALSRSRGAIVLNDTYRVTLSSAERGNKYSTTHGTAHDDELRLRTRSSSGGHNTQPWFIRTILWIDCDTRGRMTFLNTKNTKCRLTNVGGWTQEYTPLRTGRRSTAILLLDWHRTDSSSCGLMAGDTYSSSQGALPPRTSWHLDRGVT